MARRLLAGNGCLRRRVPAQQNAIGTHLRCQAGKRRGSSACRAERRIGRSSSLLGVISLHDGISKQPHRTCGQGGGQIVCIGRRLVRNGRERRNHGARLICQRAAYLDRNRLLEHDAIGGFGRHRPIQEHSIDRAAGGKVCDRSGEIQARSGGSARTAATGHQKGRRQYRP